MPDWAACFRHRGTYVKLLPIYISACRSLKTQEALNTTNPDPWPPSPLSIREKLRYFRAVISPVQLPVHLQAWIGRVHRMKRFMTGRYWNGGPMNVQSSMHPAFCDILATAGSRHGCSMPFHRNNLSACGHDGVE